MSRSSWNAFRLSGVVALLFLASHAFVPASAAAPYTITVQTNLPSYSGIQAIVITGTISPAPGPNTGVIITIMNSGGSIADADEAIPSSTTGSFNYTSIPGGNSAWTAGSFSVNATWGGDDATASQVATFAYSPSATTTTTTTTSTITTTTSTSSTTTTTTLSTTVANTSATETAPEFPSTALAAVALVVVAMVAVISRRVGVGPAVDAGRVRR